MKFTNRKAQYPGRVKLVKVAGSTDLYDMTLADGSVSGSGYSAGTPLNAETLNAMLEELNTKIRDGLFKIGLGFILFLMVFATWNDIRHLITRWFE